MSDEAGPHILVVEDDDALRALLAVALPKFGLTVLTASTLAAARDTLANAAIDLVLTDVHLGSEDGLQFCAEVRERHPLVPVLVMTAFGNLDIAVQAIRAGAWDFLTKPLDLQVARIALNRAMEHRNLRLEVRRLRQRARLADGFGELVGESDAMRRLYRVLDRVAASSSSVLVTGESGTGKELVARALHDRSARASGPFVAINCAAVPESLLESELFGHVRGAFTDARSTHVGLFVQASGGTLFLDEIGDMPQPLQAKLLRVLQERKVRPVGAEKDVAIDVRVVAATHQDLEQLVEDGRFRGDLLYRLDVIRIEMPPLRARGTDVLLLAQRFVQQHAAQLGKEVSDIAPEAAAKLLDYTWPGNVRELQNCIERAVVLAEHDAIGLDDLPPRVRDAGPGRVVLAASTDPATLLPLHVIEKRYILQVLEALGGSRSRTAEVLEIDRKTLYRKLDRWMKESGQADG